MRLRIILVGVVLALSLSLWSSANTQRSKKPNSAIKLQPLNVKPGLWETTMTVNRAGQMPLPAEMLSRLTPQQRARLEERMKANSGKAHTSTYKRCLTREQLENPDFTKDNQCTWTTLESNSTRMKGAATCNYKDTGTKLRGSGEFVALDREHVKGFVQMTASGNGRTMNTSTDFRSKWLGPRCGNVK